MGWWAAAAPILKQIGMAVATDQATKMVGPLMEKMTGGLRGGTGSNTGTKEIIPLYASSRQPGGQPGPALPEFGPWNPRPRRRTVDALLEMQSRREVMKKELEDLERRRRLADWTRRVYARGGYWQDGRF